MIRIKDQCEKKHSLEFVLHNSMGSIIYGVAMQDALHNNTKHTISKETHGRKIQRSSECIQPCVLAPVFWEIRYWNR